MMDFIVMIGIAGGFVYTVEVSINFVKAIIKVIKEI